MSIFKRQSTIVPEPTHQDPIPISSQAPWMEIAKKELGQTEISGSKNNPRIIEYHKATSLQASDDETAWCSAFANWVMLKSSIKGTDSAAALSWQNWGMKLDKPQYGCIVVFDHGGGHGHVTFFDSFNGSNLRCLGGNQSNAVKYSVYSTNEVVAYRWPKDAPLNVPIDPKPVDYAAHLGEKGWFSEYDSYIKEHLSIELLSSSIASIWGSEPVGEAKKDALCRVFRAMAVAESNLDPLCRYIESGISDPDMITHEQNVSEGLFQLSQQDAILYQCEFDWTHDKALAVKDPSKTILNPIKNLDCVMKIMTKLIRKYSPSFEISGAKYFSTLRRGRTGFDNFKNALKIA